MTRKTTEDKYNSTIFTFQHAESTRHHCNKNTQSQSHFISGFAMSLTRLTPFLLNWPGLLKFSTCRCHVLQVLAWKLLREALARFEKDLVEILVKCCQRPLRDLAQILVRSSWRCPGEILYVSLHDLVQVLATRSCGDPVAILLKSLKRPLH